MATLTSGVSFSTDYFMRTFYQTNRTAYKKSARSDYTTSELSYEDSRALHRAARALRDYEFSEDENSVETVKNAVKAYVQTYNNALDSAEDSGNRDAERYAKKLKKLIGEYADDLEDIGITRDAKGHLEVNESLLDAIKVDKVEKVFHKDAGFVPATEKLTRNLNNVLYRDLYAELTGNGGRLNIQL